MEVIPFGEIIEDRFELSKRYKLIEVVSGFWRLTEKAKKNYEPVSYIKYLKGEIDKPARSRKEVLINEILSM